MTIEKDTLMAIADRLIDQRDEPWPDNEVKRLHYWRDKAINAANDIRDLIRTRTSGEDR